MAKIPTDAPAQTVEQQIAQHRWTLDNIYTIARRWLRKMERLSYTDEERDGWRHVIRLCEKVGCEPNGVLRGNSGPIIPVVESRETPPPPTWQPIATAPKDGRTLMLYGEAFHRYVWGTGYYFKGVPGDGEGWIAHAFYTAPTNDLTGSFQPTHWMPLLAPPDPQEPS